MALGTISFLSYWLTRLGAVTRANDHTMLIQQGDSIRQLTYEDLKKDVLGEAGIGEASTFLEETTLTAAHGAVFVNPAEGVTVCIHLPAYLAVSSIKGYRIKNIGQGVVRLNAADGKTIDGDASMDFLPGDRGEVAKDGANWQTI